MLYGSMDNRRTGDQLERPGEMAGVPPCEMHSDEPSLLLVANS